MIRKALRRTSANGEAPPQVQNAPVSHTSDMGMELPPISSLGAPPTPLLDLAAESSPSPSFQSNTPSWSVSDPHTSQPSEVTGYEDSVPAKRDVKDVSGYEDAVPNKPAVRGLKQGMELEPSPASNNNNAPVHTEAPKTFGPRGLPSTADPSREVEHPPGWWTERPRGQDGLDRTGKYPARVLGNAFELEQFDATPFRKTGEQWDDCGFKKDERTFTHTATQHWNAKTIGAHKISVKNGKLYMGGNLLDTGKATGIGTQAVQDGGDPKLIGEKKYIFSMDKNGNTIAADAWAEHQEMPINSKKGKKDAYQLRMVNHSSLLGGEAAATAGEMQVESGVLKGVSNVSGHYTPNSEMTANGLKEWQDQGVDLHNVAVRMVKNRGVGPQMHVSARELLAMQAQIDERQAKKGNVNNNGPASATHDGKKNLFADMEAPPKPQEAPTKDGKIDLFAALERQQELEAQFDDAVDLMSFRRGNFETELHAFLEKGSLSHVDIEAVEAEQRRRSGVKLGKVRDT